MAGPPWVRKGWHLWPVEKVMLQPSTNDFQRHSLQEAIEALRARAPENLQVMTHGVEVLQVGRNQDRHRQID